MVRPPAPATALPPPESKGGTVFRLSQVPRELLSAEAERPRATWPPRHPLPRKGPCPELLSEVDWNVEGAEGPRAPLSDRCSCRGACCSGQPVHGTTGVHVPRASGPSTPAHTLACTPPRLSWVRSPGPSWPSSSFFAGRKSAGSASHVPFQSTSCCGLRVPRVPAEGSGCAGPRKAPCSHAALTPVPHVPPPTDLPRTHGRHTLPAALRALPALCSPRWSGSPPVRRGRLRAALGFAGHGGEDVPGSVSGSFGESGGKGTPSPFWKDHSGC